jgi:cytochrome c peroxidase
VTDKAKTPFGSRDDLRRYALGAQRLHDPKLQANGYNRCEHCHYTSHPCDVYELASAVLWLIDEGQDDVDFT